MELATIHKNIDIVKKDVKNINLKVKPSGEVILTAPLEATDDHINHIIQKRKKWILKSIEYFNKHNKVEIKEYVSGENFKYLGKNYRLKVYKNNEEKVLLLRGYLQIFIKDKTQYEKKQKMIDNWYKQKAELYFQKIIKNYTSIIQKKVNTIRVRKMKTRWGSCNPNKSYINLNIELIKKPKECIEYVIFHELAHLIHADHSKSFYNYLNTYMPDWQKRKNKLEHQN